MSSKVLTVLESKTRGKPVLPAGVDDEMVLRMYRLMLTTRLLDERAMKLQRQGRIGFYVPSIGEEACAVGSALTLSEDDWCFPSYRVPGAALVLGVSIQQMVHEWYGNAEDNTRGRQMPVHYSFAKQRFVSVSSPIGTQIIQGVGAAMGMKIRKAKAFAITYFGDGATSSNDFHAGMNFAAVFKSPCVLFCSNNEWAISCHVGEQTASETVAIKAKAYGMPGIRVDGNDVLAVYQATQEAAERARNGEGPTLIEAVTFRVGPHSSSDDPSAYREESLTDEWKKKDPIPRLKSFIKKRGNWEEKYETEWVEEITEELGAAVKAAENAPLPPTATLFEDVYGDLPPHLKEQQEELLKLEQSAGSADMDEDAAFPL